MCSIGPRRLVRSRLRAPLPGTDDLDAEVLKRAGMRGTEPKFTRHGMTGPAYPVRSHAHANNGSRDTLMGQVTDLLVGRHPRILPGTRRTAEPLLARPSVGLRRALVFHRRT